MPFVGFTVYVVISLTTSFPFLMYFFSSLAGTFTTVSVAGTTTGCPSLGIRFPFSGFTS